MSLAVFPFKSEEPALVASNLATAAAHPAIDEVWAVAPEEGDAEVAVGAIAEEVARAYGKPVEVIVQQRLGIYRSGKGDAMNTALARAAGQGRDRVHFYDADITNFDSSWIEGAEVVADRGFGVVQPPIPSGRYRRYDHLDDHPGLPWPVSSRGRFSPDSTNRWAVSPADRASRRIAGRVRAGP